MQCLDAGVTTLTGTGGVGKTSLALELVESIRDRFDAVWICELAGVSEVAALDDAVADSIGAFRNHDASAVAAVTAALQGRRTLLLLDNVEQIAGGTGRFVTALVDGCPGLTVLVTSREPLRIAAEIVVVIQPLDVEIAAPALFARQAALANPEIDVAEHGDDIAAICRDLDGLPLAVELAAARLGSMSVPEVRSRLDRRFGLLRQETNDARHATLAGVIQWSWDLLAPHERRLFDRLSVFHGGFDVAGAMAVAGGTRETAVDQATVIGVLDSLTDKSMLVQFDTPIGTRWCLLESLRHFGDRQLAERGERSSVRNAHLDRMIEVVSLAGGACYGDDWAGGVAMFRADWDNVRVAIDWAIGIQRPGDVDRLLRDVFVMARWTLDAEPSVWAARAIERGDVTELPVGAPAHLHVAFSHFLAGDHDAALAANLAALDVSATPSDTSWAHHYAAVELLYLGRSREAADMANQALTEPAARPTERAIQQSASVVFKLLAGDIDAEEANATIDAARDLAAMARNPVASGHVAYNRGMVAAMAGRSDEAGAAHSVAMAIARTHHVPNLIGYALTAQVYQPGATGLAAAAEALDWWRDHRDVSNEFVVLEAAGINLVEVGRLDEGGLLLGHLEQESRRIASSEKRRIDAIDTLRRSRRGRAAIERGASMTRSDLLDHARAAVAAAVPH